MRISHTFVDLQPGNRFGRVSKQIAVPKIARRFQHGQGNPVTLELLTDSPKLLVGDIATLNRCRQTVKGTSMRVQFHLMPNGWSATSGPKRVNGHDSAEAAWSALLLELSPRRTPRRQTPYRTRRSDLRKTVSSRASRPGSTPVKPARARQASSSG